MIKDSWIRPYLSENKWLLALVLILGTGTFFSAGALMFTSGYLISESATLPENILLVYVPIVLVRLFGVSRPAFRYAERLSGHSMVLKILSRMRVRLYKTLEPNALDFKSRFKTGDLLGVLADDIEHLQDVYIKTIFPAVISLLLYAMIVLGLGYFSIPFALLMLLLLFVLVILFPLVSLLTTHARHAKRKDARNGLYQTLTDAVMGAGDWMISGRQADFIQRYENDERTADIIEGEISKFQRYRNLLFHIIILVAIISMTCWIAANVEGGGFEPSWIAAFILVVFPLIDAFAPLSDAVSQLPSYQSSLERMNGLKEQKEEKNHLEQTGIQELKKKTSLPIQFDQITFSYNEEAPPVLEDLTLSIQAGEKIALLGKSGSGKSTLAKLILSAYEPQKGKITIGGKPVNKLGELSSLIAVLQQKPHLFDTTVMNNIRLGNPAATDEEVIKAAKKVQMHDYIISLPDGYDTRMHELGSRFSGGERQRIALARILLQDVPIAILDEPTVGLDALTEKQLLKTIFETLQSKTVIWITHHLAGAETMDRMIFLEDGAIKMDGTHAELMETEEAYRNLYRLDMPEL
ncbi:thiol reductant ABC exporter subunit CydC [Pradoshia eiseniae]|uniref:Thiol reductant ABC exporter subunit CydC n=1 Tax=Pradoshia eiseniae TaxID=2064768 RepID=A0A2S7N5K1_9BACI|nr:thiol reductant ABC exporter subunit CydC [Pradoshia eiseniae]PQD97230.1 thiol reductant ABC exporter subunit CydC [Pradoshia eiseniae]